jgi:SAM-dependent methyltransferase
MADPDAPADRGYETLYEEFDSPLMHQLRIEAYGEDLGQHSWVTGSELESCGQGLGLTASSRLLDLGCGPGGPLSFVVTRIRCRAVGVDLSHAAIAAARARIATQGLDALVLLLQADANEPIPLMSSSFDAVMSMDTVLHLRDRTALFRQVARVLISNGKFWFTDAAVVTGPVSSEEVALRSMHGYTQFVPSGFNERALEDAGFQLMRIEDRTAALLGNARGRLSARLAHRAELEQVEGAAYFERQLRYLETVVELAERGATSRVSYLAERRLVGSRAGSPARVSKINGTSE